MSAPHFLSLIAFVSLNAIGKCFDILNCFSVLREKYLIEFTGIDIWCLLLFLS